jgi:hypothetical protein
MRKLIAQARIIFVRSGYELRHYQAKCEPYDEGAVDRLLPQLHRTPKWILKKKEVFMSALIRQLALVF